MTAQSALVNQASQRFSAERVFRQLCALLLLPTPTESNDPKEREDPVSLLGTREEPTFLQLSGASPRNNADKHQQVGTKQTFSKGLFTFFYPRSFCCSHCLWDPYPNPNPLHLFKAWLQDNRNQITSRTLKSVSRTQDF